MKKFVALLLVITMSMSLCIAVSAAQFSDLTEKHWSYANIQKLVSEGTVKGYPDGSFRPEATVTRAEFAKMFGAGKNKKSGDFKDLNSSHWSYSYVMASGVDADKEFFRPDEFMTRGEVLDALWDRCGVKVDAKVPGVIARQFENEDAITWAYTTQLIKGNDGIDLRLSDTITRAEVAALILRVRNLDTKNLKKITDNVSEVLITKVNETLDLFEGGYSPEKKVTYGQAAHAAMLLAYGTDDYAPAAQFEITFEGKYSYAMSGMTAYIWEKSKNTKEYSEKNVTVQDALLAIMNAVVTSMQKDIPVGSSKTTYSDAVKTNGKEENVQILKETDKYPKNHKDYGVIVENIPAYIFSNAGFKTLPKDSYYTANSYKSILKTYIDSIVNLENKKTAYKVDVTYYPSLVSISKEEIEFVLKLEFKNVASGTTFASVLPKASAITQKIEEGKTYYVLATSGVAFSDYIPTDNTKLVKIIAAY